MKIRGALLGLALACLAPRLAVAQSPPATPEAAPVDAWISEGIRLRGERRDEEALALFRRAWEAAPRPEPRAQIALAEQALGRWVEAERDLLGALETPTDPWIERYRRTLDAALREVRNHLGSLEVRSHVAGARLRVDGRDEGALPRSGPLRLVVGTILLEVTAPGHNIARRTVELHAGDDLLETLDPAAPLASGPVVGPVVTPPPPRVPAPRPPWMRPLGVGLVLSSSAFLGGGIAGLVWRESSARAFNADRPQLCTINPASGATEGAPECPGLRAQSDGATALAVTGMVLAAGLLTAGLALALSSRRASTAQIACAPGLRSLACGVRF